MNPVGPLALKVKVGLPGYVHSIDDTIKSYDPILYIVYPIK